MQVRGAPAIAITAALSLAVELTNSEAIRELKDAQAVLQAILKRLDHLITRWGLDLQRHLSCLFIS